MIKKILCAFLMIMVSGIANANIHIDGKIVSKIALEHIDSDHQVSALQEYNIQLKATGNYTMSAAGLYKVCTAAGWDIATPEGKTKCDDFVMALVAESDYKYYEVCGKDKGKSGGTEHCIDNVFDGLLSGIQVTMLQADGLCKEYAKVKYNDDIECSSQKRAGTINKANDYVKCTSKLNPTYYEFKFDDVVESSDSEILRGVLKGVGSIYNVELSDPGCTIERIINNTACNIGYKTTDVKICENLNNSLKRFGYTSKIGNVTRAGLNSEKLCAISGITTVSGNLKTAYGIPNDVFYDGLIQMQGSKDVKEGIKQYVTEKIKPEKLTSFECISNTIKMPSIKGKKDKDDVLTCYVNGNQIDFVFDDLSEAGILKQQGAKEAFQCTYNGGLLTGKRCLNVGEEACKKIAQSTFLVQECPECSKLYWNGNICTLPAAATSNVLDKGLNIALIVGGAALNVFIAVGTGGTSTAAGGWLLFIETVGSAIELGTEISMDIAADKFFVESSKCHDKTCANDLIKKHLQRLSNFYSRLTGAEERAIDKEMARLFKLIPAEELFTIEALVKVDQENGGKKLASVKDNQKGFFDSKSWEPEQIWQAVGITMQFTGLVYQMWNKLFGKSNTTAKVMTEVANVLDYKADEVARSGKLSREQIQKMVQEGKLVETPKGFEIPNGKLAAEVATQDGALTGIKGKTKYQVMNVLDDWMHANGSELLVQYDKNMKAVYTAGIRDEAMPTIKQWLYANRIPHEWHGNYVQILETDLETIGKFARSADDPIITSLIDSFGEDAYVRAIDNATSIDEMEKVSADIMTNREYINIVFKDAIDTQELERYALSSRQKYIDIIANDRELSQMAKDFNALNMAQKQDFANKIISKYNAGVCNGGTCQVVSDLGGLGGNHGHGIIQISDTYNRTLDDFMNTLAHENNHFFDERGVGFLNKEQSRLGTELAGDFTENLEIYNTNLTEHASYEIGKIVGTDFSKDLFRRLRF